jgi:hypothetical protein
MPDLAQLVPQNGHATANAAVPLWQFNYAGCLSTPHLTTNQQVRLSLVRIALWQARCTIPFAGHVRLFKNPEK